MPVQPDRKTFVQTTSTNLENRLANKTVGLHTLISFTKKREEVLSSGTRTNESDQNRAKKEPRAPNAQIRRTQLSFATEEIVVGSRPKRIVKDSTVDTSFLPDRDREEQERQQRLEIEREWLAKQEKMKQQKINVTYSYYDGAGHRRNIVVTRGTTVEAFLGLVCNEFKQLAHLTTDQLMFVKEDLIIPPYYSFHDLIETRARGKSGPLFYWDVHDDVRIVNDATIEKQESHAAKVMERSWYESNKHMFPMNRWEIFDPEKSNTFTTYTIKDKVILSPVPHRKT